MITIRQLATKIAICVGIQALEAYLALLSWSHRYYIGIIFFGAVTLLSTSTLHLILNKWRTVR